MAEVEKKAFVIGWPISHSLSPDLHQYWLKQYGINGSYEKFAVAPEDLAQFVNDLKAKNFVGGNVTIPHKEDLCTLIDDQTEIVQSLQALNTIWFEDGQLKTDNTDGYGFTANLDDFTPDWRKAENALILGAGGASKAIVLALKSAGIKTITITNRTRQRADDLVKNLGTGVFAADMQDIPDLLVDTDLLVNTTSLGMKNQPKLEIDLTPLLQTAIVTDLVYNPLETELLKQAKSLNLKTVDGIGMLLHQAVPGFEKWFGVRPQVTTQLRQHMLQRLKVN